MISEGLELVLNYVPYYFHPNEISSGTQIMTEFIARVASLVMSTANLPSSLHLF